MLLTNGDIGTLLKKRVIINGAEESIEGQKYNFRLGDSFLKAQFGHPTKISELDVDHRMAAIIEPGETVFVRTEEVLKLPKDMRLRLSPKQKISEEGIIVVREFDVDPGYSGPIIAGMHNFSSEPFILHQGREVIAGIFEKLDEKVKFTPTSMPDDGFPKELMDQISKYKPANIQTVLDEIRNLKDSMRTIKTDLKSVKEQTALKSFLNGNWFFAMVAVVAIIAAIFK